jgi:hypothetical protein
MNSLPRFAQTFLTIVGLTFALALTVAGPAAMAQSTTFATLHEFAGTDGSLPTSNLVSDAAGNLYGVAPGGGQYGSNCWLRSPYYNYCGVVFKLSRVGSEWTTTILHEFTGGSDGNNPIGGLILDKAGNLYGTTTGVAFGNGNVFELSPNSDGTWTETVLYAFQGGSDGSAPEGNLTFDNSGNLFGTTFGGGPGFCGLGVPCGTVFELSPNSAGGWTETVLYSFSELADGAEPVAGLTLDKRGNLYGTTTIGGNLSGNCGYPAFGCGTVFELSPNGAGGWSKTALYTFTDGADGAAPYAGVILDAAGNLYGTASAGGNLNGCNAFGCGVVYRLYPNSSGTWTETVIHTFQLLGTHIGQGGGVPLGGLIFDAAHNLYGTASDGGSLPGGAPGFGVVFKLSPASGKNWKETVLHTFSSTDGAAPASSLFVNSSGYLIGTTRYGGISNFSNPDCGYASCGVVFALKP